MDTRGHEGRSLGAWCHHCQDPPPSLPPDELQQELKSYTLVILLRVNTTVRYTDLGVATLRLPVSADEVAAPAATETRALAYGYSRIKHKTISQTAVNWTLGVLTESRGGNITQQSTC